MDRKEYFNRIIEDFSNRTGDLINREQAGNDTARRSKGLLFAKAALGHTIEDIEFEPLLERIYYRRDCTDFDVNVLIRMLFLFGGDKVISPAMLAEIKEVLLDYDYWFHENNIRPGNQIIWTENHVFQYLTAEYLSARLFPEDVFRMRGLRGGEIGELIGPKIIDYIRIKGKTGFCEWNSNVYADENFHALLNLFDFSGDGRIARMSKDLLDVMFFQMAVNSYEGHYGCSHGRAYDRNVISPLNDSTGALQLLAWDLGGPISSLESVSGLAFATSGYAVPDMINRIALDRDSVVETREQQSFDVEDGPLLGKGYEKEEDLVLYWHNMAYTHRLVLKNNIAMERKYHLWINEWTYFEYRNMLRCEREGKEVPICRCSNYMGRVNTVNYKTPDYMLSCAQDFRRGERGYQQHIWQATMGNGAILFTNHPGPGPRPGYWAGNDIMPKAVQHKGTLIAMYDLTAGAAYPYTHAFFPVQAFDEVREKEGWLFARKGNGYGALHSQNGYEWADSGKPERNEVICKGLRNIWLCQMGRKSEHGGFTDFINTVLGCGISFDGMNVSYMTPGGDHLEMGYDSSLILNGKAEETSDYKRISNVYADSEYMGGRYTITDGKEKIMIDFNRE